MASDFADRSRVSPHRKHAGPLDPTVGGDEALLRDMHQVGGGLFLTGGLLVLAVFALSSWPAIDRPLLLGTAIVAIGTGLGLIAAPRWRLLPSELFPWFAVLGSVNVTVAILASGASGSAPFGVLYVFVSIFSFYYLRFGVALAIVTFAAVCHALALGAVHLVDAPAQWLVVTVGTAVAGLLIGRVGQRDIALLAQERVALERLRDLDELRTTFLRAVSHELRTPLTAVIGFTEILQMRGAELTDAQEADLVTRIGSNAAKLERLLGNLLDIDRISRGVVQPLRHPTDVGELVNRTIFELRTPSHTIEVELTGDLLIDVEASKVERIVENLVANAIRHTPRGSRILVATTGDDDGVDIIVEDDGPGLLGIDTETVFEPFAQGQDASASPSPGTGIGLALVANFAKLHGGLATAGASKLGGAYFGVRLPRLAAESETNESEVEVTTSG